ncbi:MAG: peptidoglycan DD-metalloendopeptidase family protein [Sulfurospirillaceae bacterium]|nr:peptidoglycan DD-metalloendopeptidase family protein [Sulfurospirillaceae bacterium]
MKDKFTITISDINGSKHYELHQKTKKIIVYFFLFVTLMMIAGSCYIYFLSHEVISLEGKKHIIVQEYSKLEQNNQKLQDEISKKTQEYGEIKDKINDIEELVGLTPNKKEKISDRLDNLTFTTKQQQIIFQNIPSGYPIPFKGITAKFGWRIHPILHTKEFHKGIDLKAAMGTPIHAPADGVVEYAGFHKSSGFGNLVMIDHNFGFKTIYGHLRKKMVVKAGEFVKKGQIIGYTGDSGLSTGPHLHYEVRFISRPLNPYNFLVWNNSDFKNIFKKEARVSWESLINMINQKFHLQKLQLSRVAQK